MANQVPLAYADVRLQLATAISASDTSFTLSSATDDDGNSLPAGKYCFTIDNGSSNKEYLIGQLNGVNVTSVVSVSRQGVESSGAARAHRVGATVILSDFATIQRVGDILRGQENLDGDNPILYDAEPTLSDRKELATVGYVLDNVSGGTISFDSLIVSGTGGETIAAGELVYFKTSDQEWYLCDADTSTTVHDVQVGIALGAGSDGVSITGGVQIAGTYTTSGLTAGSTYYASNTAGAIATSAGTTEKSIGIALSTTALLLDLQIPYKEALAGGGNFGTPSSTNKFLTEDYSKNKPPEIVEFTTSGTWTKDAGLNYIIVEGVGAGGGGGGSSDFGTGDGTGGMAGGSGGYFRKIIDADTLGATETVTIGTGGTGGSAGATGGTGTTTSFGSHCQSTSGTGGTTDQTAFGAGGTATGGDINITGNSGISGGTDDTDNGNEDPIPGGYVPSVLGSKGRGGQPGWTSRGIAGSAGGDGYIIVTEYYS